MSGQPATYQASPLGVRQPPVHASPSPVPRGAPPALALRGAGYSSVLRARRRWTTGDRVCGRRTGAGRRAAGVGPAAAPGIGPAVPDTAAEPAGADYDIGHDLVRGIGQLAAVDIDTLTDTQLAAHLSALKAPLGQLRALQARWAAAMESRRIAAAPPQRQGAAQREARNALADQQQLTPSETKRLVEAGRAAGKHRATGAAFDDGHISPEHVRVIADVLQHLLPPQQAELEPRLVALAKGLHATRFGREARRLVADLCPPAAADAEDVVRGRRYLRATDTPDGGFAFSGLLYGTAAETARVALDAFTRPDAAGEHRTREQAAADGFEQLCAAALRTGEAPTQHGVRPQVLVSMDAEQLAASSRPDGTGIGTFVWSGQPVTSRELGHLLDDCAFIGVLHDAQRTPIEVTTQVRTVPVGLWRALLVRDGGCTWPGCDAPAAWCDVAHGQTPFHEDGRLMPSNAALLCRSHHRRFDIGPWTIHVRGDQVTFLRPAAEPRAGPTTGTQPQLLPGADPPDAQEPAPMPVSPTDAQLQADAQLPADAQPPPGTGGCKDPQHLTAGWVTPDGRFVTDLTQLG